MREREFWICHWTLYLEAGKVNWGALSPLWGEKGAVESSKEEGKGYSLWEQLGASAWECPQDPKNGEKQPPKPKSGEKLGVWRSRSWGKNGMLWPQPP